MVAKVSFVPAYNIMLMFPFPSNTMPACKTDVKPNIMMMMMIQLSSLRHKPVMLMLMFISLCHSEDQALQTELDSTPITIIINYWV